MEIDEITIPSPDFPDGQSSGRRHLMRAQRKGRLTRPASCQSGLSHRCRVWGIDWYPLISRTRGTISVAGNRITLRPTVPVLVERAVWWRCCGYWMLAHSHRQSSVPAETRRRVSRT